MNSCHEVSWIICVRFWDGLAGAVCTCGGSVQIRKPDRPWLSCLVAVTAHLCSSCGSVGQGPVGPIIVSSAPQLSHGESMISPTSYSGLPIELSVEPQQPEYSQVRTASKDQVFYQWATEAHVLTQNGKSIEWHDMPQTMKIIFWIC